MLDKQERATLLPPLFPFSGSQSFDAWRPPVPSFPLFFFLLRAHGEHHPLMRETAGPPLSFSLLPPSPRRKEKLSGLDAHAFFFSLFSLSSGEKGAWVRASVVTELESASTPSLLPSSGGEVEMAAAITGQRFLYAVRALPFGRNCRFLPFPCRGKQAT